MVPVEFVQEAAPVLGVSVQELLIEPSEEEMKRGFFEKTSAQPSPPPRPATPPSVSSATRTPERLLAQKQAEALNELMNRENLNAEELAMALADDEEERERLARLITECRRGIKVLPEKLLEEISEVFLDVSIPTALEEEVEEEEQEVPRVRRGEPVKEEPSVKVEEKEEEEAEERKAPRVPRRKKPQARQVARRKVAPPRKGVATEVVTTEHTAPRAIHLSLTQKEFLRLKGESPYEFARIEEDTWCVVVCTTEELVEFLSRKVMV